MRLFSLAATGVCLLFSAPALANRPPPSAPLHLAGCDISVSQTGYAVLKCGRATPKPARSSSSQRRR